MKDYSDHFRYIFNIRNGVSRLACSTTIINFATPLGTVGHERIIVAATATIGVFGFDYDN